MTTTQKIRKQVLSDKPHKPPIPLDSYCSTGIPLLNLAVSGKVNGGIPKGTYFYFVGDSISGKSFITLGVLAEACMNVGFKEHRLIHDNAENGALMDVTKFFGPKLAKLIEPPQGHPDDPKYSSTVEEMYYNIDNALDEGPCIYIVDSMDALLAMDDEAKFEEQKAAHGSDKEVKGSYGMAKAKANSNHLKRVVARLRDTGSILILISQTRDKIKSPFPMRTRSGGKALRFYAHCELWTSVKDEIKKDVLGKERVIGSRILIDVQKNRLTGWDGKVLVPFFRSVGMDATGASVDFLTDEGHWPIKKKVITATEFGFEGKREQLIASIEAENGEDELHQLVQQVWDKVEAACAVQRKPRYE